MKKINLLYTAVIGVTIALSSCNDFLDKMPDSRTEVNNEKKITAILVSAYPQTYPIMSYELASDNTMDNGSNYDPYWKSITQMYRWEDVNEIDDDDPKGIWEGCYSAIASANIALQSADCKNRCRRSICICIGNETYGITRSWYDGRTLCKY